MKVIVMYLGHIQEWMNEEVKHEYNNLSTQDLIAKYLEILDYANQPLYPFQISKMKIILENIEEHISNNIYDDLISLRDKDLIIKYNLEPKIIAMRYHGMNVDDIRASNKTEHIYKKENFVNQYNSYIKKFGDKYARHEETSK